MRRLTAKELTLKSASSRKSPNRAAFVRGVSARPEQFDIEPPVLSPMRPNPAE